MNPKKRLMKEEKTQINVNVDEEVTDDNEELEILDESITKRYKSVPNYFCSKCKFSSKHFDAMAIHIKAHLNSNIKSGGNSKFKKQIKNGSIFGCQLCCLGFLTAEERSDHILDIHSIEDFTSDVENFEPRLNTVS